MRAFSKFICVIVLTISPTLQLAANESEAEQFKQQLLTELMGEIKELEPAEIRRIINEVEQNIDEYIDKYEKHPEKLRTKDEVYLEQHAHEVAPKTFSMLQRQSGKSEEQLILEELNPRLKMMPDDAYQYNEETKEIEFNENRLSTFAAANKPFYAWDYLAKGDVLINFDNGSSSGLFKWGHAGIVYSKGHTAATSWTIEAPGGDKSVMVVNYNDVWHSNKNNRIAYNYVPSVYKTNKPSLAANEAKKYEGRPYGIWHPLGQSYEIYCTELVYLAYKSQGVDLGNGVKKGDWWILMPKRMYCDADLSYYYRQHIGGGMC
jgi:hypothetical protein